MVIGFENFSVQDEYFLKITRHKHKCVTYFNKKVVCQENMTPKLNTMICKCCKIKNRVVELRAVHDGKLTKCEAVMWRLPWAFTADNTLLILSPRWDRTESFDLWTIWCPALPFLKVFPNWQIVQTLYWT